MDLSIIVVSWNAKRYVHECLTSLQQISSAVSCEVIVVDNASTDGTPELIQEQFPHVTLLLSPSNVGFARGNNIGIQAASGSYLCLINSDVNVPPGCLEDMFHYMEANPTIGLLGPQMLGADGSVRRSTMRRPSLPLTLCRALALDSLAPGLFRSFLMTDFDHKVTMDVDVLNGWFWMARNTAVAEVGMLDERFFMYGEDIDWCSRFTQKGWRVVFFSNAGAVHYGGASSARAPVRFYIEMQRADLQYWEKHHGFLGKIGFLLTLWIHHCIRLAGYAVVYPLRWLQHNTETVSLKIRRSSACLAWLSGRKPSY